MKKFYVLVGLFLCLATQGFSQKSLSDYSYIIVSEQFEFQDEKDKYQLNSLTKFLFNKYGFHAFFKGEVPSNVRRCDGLLAEAEGKPGFIVTKVELVIRDCEGTEVFRSIEGKSNIKDYKNAYYEAMREAFKSVRNLYVNQKEINTYENEIVKTTTIEPVKVVSTAVVTKKDVDNQAKENSQITFEMSTLKNLPSAKFSGYSYAGKTFLLRKTKKGYSFYEESNESDDGLLLVGKIALLNTDIVFIDLKNNTLKAQFDTSKNLIIKSEGATITYTLVN